MKTRPTLRLTWILFLELGLLSLVGLGTSAEAPALRWENYVSKHCTFTVLKPVGWVVKEGYQDAPRMWTFLLTDPEGRYQVATIHGLSLTGRNADALVRAIVADMAKSAPDLQLAPTARMRRLKPANNDVKASEKTVFIFEGAYTSPRGGKREFRALVTGGDGLMLNQRIEAPAGQLAKAAPLLLQVLANLRVAKGVYSFDEGGVAAQSAPAQPPQLAPQQLASGWARFAAPPGWKTTDLGGGMCIVTDPAQRLYFLVGGSEFIAPRYYVNGVRGVLCSEFRAPSDAFAFAAVQNGLASDFRPVFVKKRNDLLQQMRAFAGPLRPVAVEDFSYTCTLKGRRYRTFSTGGCCGDAMQAAWRLWHFTIMAPADEFETALPTLAAIMGSYETNKEMAGRRVAQNMANYYAGLRNLSNQIARNSEQMRRENLELFMERGRVQDYLSYQTTRMIMGDYDYLAGSYGYVRGDASGLYKPDGTRITSEPYGESITRHMQEINSRALYEAVRPR